MKKITLNIIKLYKTLISPLLVNVFGTGCRYTPTCSTYCYESVERFGFLKGSLLAIKRLSRCHPFSKGHFDPTPDRI